MNNTIYTINEENKLKAELKELVNKYRRLSQILQQDKHKRLVKFINYKTPLLQSDNYTIVTKVYWVLHNLTDFPKCANPDCSNIIGINDNVKLTRGYAACCSKLCAARNPDRLAKIQETCLDKYGVNSPMQSAEVQADLKQAIFEKYGTDSIFKVPEIKRKTIQTNLRKYGVTVANQFNSTSEIKQKYEQSMFNKYGVEHPWQTEEVQNKNKNTMLNRYGVENPGQSAEIQAKVRQTCLDRYGVSNPAQSAEIQDKIKETVLERYGVSNPAQSAEIQEKMKATCLKKYGTEYYFQSSHCNKHRRALIEYDDMKFDSKAELNYYKHCKANGQDVRRADVRLTYMHDDKVCYYYPDFMVDGQLVEIKGDHFFRLNEETGDEEMFMPFSSWGADKPMAESEHIGLCDKYNAKYNCMLDNDVIIIKSSEVNNV